jgi:TonB family protein
VEVAQAIAAPAPSEQTADRAVTTTPEIADGKVPAPLPQALRTVHGTIGVEVRVMVAPDGTVQSSELVKPARSPYFNRLSLEAAQGSRFQPSADGRSVVLRYEYSRAGVQVGQPTPAVSKAD